MARRKLSLNVVAALATMALAAPAASAAPITWNFTGSGGQGTLGNTRTFTSTSGGVSVQASAWSNGRGSTDTFVRSALGQWSGGLGVCNPNEFGGCDSPYHQVDNSGMNDAVLFLFGEPVDPSTVHVHSYGNGSQYDVDVTYWVGTVNQTGFGLLNTTYSQLAGLGFGSPNSWYCSGGGCTPANQDIPIAGSGLINALLFSANIDGGGEDDYFKVASMTAETGTPVPEPGSMLLLGTGLFGLAGAVRRRTKK